MKKGINNMPKNWTVENEWNKKVYKKWKSMLERCYSEKVHKREPTYIDCSVCDRWLLLSNFVEDVTKIDGYDEEEFLSGKLCLDKDIKSNGKNKEYSLENCVFVNKRENSKQMLKTRDNNYLQGKNHPMYKGTKIIQYDKQGNLIKVWNDLCSIEHELRIDRSHIISCCKWYDCREDLNEWHKIKKGYPNKSAGGFVWKYYKGEDE